MVKPQDDSPKDRDRDRKSDAVDPAKAAKVKGSGHRHTNGEPMAVDPGHGADVEGSGQA